MEFIGGKSGNMMAQAGFPFLSQPPNIRFFFPFPTHMKERMLAFPTARSWSVPPGPGLPISVEIWTLLYYIIFAGHKESSSAICVMYSFRRFRLSALPLCRDGSVLGSEETLKKMRLHFTPCRVAVTRYIYYFSVDNHLIPNVWRINYISRPVL